MSNAQPAAKVRTSANDGWQALTRVREHPPGAMVVDLELPGLDGLQFIDLCRAIPDCIKIPVVLMSARHRHRDAREHIEGKGVAVLLAKRLGAAGERRVADSELMERPQIKDLAFEFAISEQQVVDDVARLEAWRARRFVRWLVGRHDAWREDTAHFYVSTLERASRDAVTG